MERQRRRTSGTTVAVLGQCLPGKDAIPEMEPMDNHIRSSRPIRRAPVGIAVVIAAIVAFGAPAAALAWTNYTYSSTDENKTITLINQARAAAGLPALVESSALNDVARWRAKDMWDRNYFGHDIPNPPGGKVFDELKRRGICYTVAGENIGRNNYPDDQTTQVNFNSWMSSSTHKGLILGSGFNRIGVGAFKGTGTTYPNHIFVAIFTHSCSSATPTPGPPPPPTPRPNENAGSVPDADATPDPDSDAAPNPHSDPACNPNSDPARHAEAVGQTDADAG